MPCILFPSGYTHAHRVEALQTSARRPHQITARPKAAGVHSRNPCEKARHTLVELWARAKLVTTQQVRLYSATKGSFFRCSERRTLLKCLRMPGERAALNYAPFPGSPRSVFLPVLRTRRKMLLLHKLLSLLLRILHAFTAT